MYTGYLDNLPEVQNKFNVKLDDGERVVFTAKLELFGTASGRMLGGDNSKFTMTNKRIIASNGAGVWNVEIAEDIVSCEEIDKGVLIFKEHYYLIMMNKTISFGENLSETMDGFRFYFKKKDRTVFAEIINNLLNFQ